MTPSRMRLGLNLWPPLLFNGIRVTHIAPDWTSATVRLKLHKLTRNNVGTAFGGALSSMTDPLFMLLKISMDTVDQIRADCANGVKTLTWFDTHIADETGTTVAEVRRQVYVRLKAAYITEPTATEPFAAEPISSSLDSST